MLSQLIRSILDENNPSTSSCMEDRMSLFEDKAEDKKMRIQANNFLSQASIYSADLDTVQKNRFYFLKPALKGMKQNFLADFPSGPGCPTPQRSFLCNHFADLPARFFAI